MSSKSLMVIAHPDDEAIFGGYLLEQPDDWVVLCVTNGYKPHRSSEFYKSMEIAGAQGVIWEFLDKLGVPLDAQVSEMLKDFIEAGDYDRFVTHGEDGETDHIHHKQIHAWMKKIVGNKLETFDLSKRKLTPMAQAYRSQQQLYQLLIPML